MTAETLETLYREHAGKASDKWSSYLHEYGRIFADLREREVRLLEIGIQNGGSLEIWSQFFPKASAIVGCDINPDCARLTYDDPRIHVVVGDANTDEAEATIRDISAAYDIIIDDGSHRSSDIVRTFDRYFPFLTGGGVFIAEDLHCSYWADFEGGLFAPFSSLAFFKRLADVVNHEHWGVDKTRSFVLRHHAQSYGLTLQDEHLSQIHALEFLNSMCIVRKASAERNALGFRVVAGFEELVVPGHLEMQGSPTPEPHEESNAWSNRDLAPEEELPLRVAELAEGALHIAQCEAELREKRDSVQLLSGELETREQRLVASGATMVQSGRRVVATENHGRLLEQRLQDAKKTINDLKHALAVAQHQYALVVSSPSWRMTRHVRAANELALAKRASLIAWASASTAPAARLMKGALEVKTSAQPSLSVYRALRRTRKVVRQQGVGGAARRLLEIVTGRAPARNPKAIRKALAKNKATGAKKKSNPQKERNNYREWLRRYDVISEIDRAAMRARAKAFRRTPLISIVMPTYDTEPQWLIEAIDSVQSQIYPHWELCIADDASTRGELRPILEHYAREDPRIKVTFRAENGHISAASNSALELVTGEWVALLDHDDILREHALFWLVDAINRKQDVRLVYSDEDKIHESGKRTSPHFKPDFNEDLFRSYNMICHLAAYDTALVREVGGFRVGFEGAQDYDLALRCVDKLEPRQIHHVPRVLYSWRVHPASTAEAGGAKPYALDAGKRALDEHLSRRNLLGRAEATDFGMYRIRYALPDNPPKVSIVIPTKNALTLVKQCVDSIIDQTAYPNYEIVIVDNGSDDEKALAYFERLAKSGKARVLRDDRPFNYSALNNEAVRAAEGDVICLMNNDIEVISEDWLSEMVSLSLLPNVGAVGARLWYPNDKLQHGGVLLGVGGVAGHAHKRMARGRYGYFGRAAVTQSLSAVTAACLVIKKSIYEQVGGLNEIDLEIAFNDIDFCLRVREAGYRNVWTPFADLYHHESATRGSEDTPEKRARFSREVLFMQARWGRALEEDPAYNPNLTLQYEDMSLAWPPRLQSL
jgi:glycosyltransferase involved in cell wall biosynthesis